MARQQKRKTHNYGNPAKRIKQIGIYDAKQTDDGMVVFPMANGKLATTWVQNVDAILSEGTGNLSIERLSQLKDKLTNTLSLLDSRLAELQMKQIEEEANKARQEAIQYIIDHYIGTQVRVFPVSGPSKDQCDGFLLTSASVSNDMLHMEGICAFSYKKYVPGQTCAHEGIIQTDLHEKVSSMHVIYPDEKNKSHFKLTFDRQTIGVLEFGSPSVKTDDNQKELIDTFFKQIGQRKHAFEKPVRKKLKLSIKRGPKHD